MVPQGKNILNHQIISFSFCHSYRYIYVLRHLLNMSKTRLTAYGASEKCIPVAVCKLITTKNIHTVDVIEPLRWSLQQNSVFLCS